MTMNDPGDRDATPGGPRDKVDELRVSMAGRDGMAHSDRMSDAARPIGDRAPGWLLPAVLAVVVIAGMVAYAVSTDRKTAGTAPGPPVGSRPRRRSGDDQSIGSTLAQVRGKVGLREGRIPGLVDNARRRHELCERRQQVQQAGIEPLARGLAPFVVVDHVPGMSSGRIGVMKRVNTVRSGNRSAIADTTGSTRASHDVGQGPSGEKMRCMSTQR